MQREVKPHETDGMERVKVSYPKFKNGEATVRDVRVRPNFGMHVVHIHVHLLRYVTH